MAIDLSISVVKVWMAYVPFRGISVCMSQAYVRVGGAKIWKPPRTVTWHTCEQNLVDNYVSICSSREPKALKVNL